MSARHKRPSPPAQPPAGAASQMPPGMLGVPCLDWMWTDAVRSLMQLRGALPDGSVVCFSGNGSSSASFNRNQMVREFLERPALEWLLFVDSDMIVPPDAAQRLYASGKDIIGALYWTRNPPYTLEGVPFQHVPGDAPFCLMQTQAVGAGCMMIQRRVLEKMPHPWFADMPGGRDEDYRFCHEASGAGFEVWLDGRIQCGHIGATTITTDFVRGWLQTSAGRAVEHTWAGGPRHPETPEWLAHFRAQVAK